MSSPPLLLHLGSKAETLAQLASYSGAFRVPPLLRFTATRWCAATDGVLAEIQSYFGQSLLAVRSSAHSEDGATSSQAGAFVSHIGVRADDADALRAAIASVLASYAQQPTVAGDSAGEDEVLVQEMVTQIDASGVILTRCVDDGSPYYVFSYDDESGTSDAVTAGRGTHKTVLLYRGARTEHCDSPRLRRMLALARELEALIPNQPLDIEFALDRHGVMHLLQVRRIVSVRDWHPDAEHQVARALPHVERFITELAERHPGLLGKTTLLGNMPDWNPAELIGVIPTSLAASLFRSLISAGVWHQARSAMGYRVLPPTDLLVLVAGHAFIDVRASFNSFLPEGLVPTIGEKLVDFWLQRLADMPALHDKVEFEVATTVLDFDFSNRLATEYTGVLTAQEQAEWLERLVLLTRGLLILGPEGNLAQAEASINRLAARPPVTPSPELNPSARTVRIAQLLDECRTMGTHAFAMLARHAFVAEALLRSAVRRGVLAEKRLAEFKASITTVMGELAQATRAVCAGELCEADFLHRFGHLRPGTFDLLSPCYRDRSNLFAAHNLAISTLLERPAFTLSAEERRDLDQLLDEVGLRDVVDAEGLLEYSRRAIRGREYGKFIFTRHLSAALEEIAAWGGQYCLGRDELSYLRIEEILDTRQRSARMEPTSRLMQLVDQARLDRAQARVVRLSYLVRGVRDVYVVPMHRSEPTFITRARVEAPLVRLWPTSVGDDALAGRIACIENADPGFDWIFTRGIAGLITQYGGANSHMAIRCAELQLPAAIGCGEALFKELQGAQCLLLDCASRRLEAVVA